MNALEILMKPGRRDVLSAMMALNRSGHTAGPLVHRVKNLCAEHGLTLEETATLGEEAGRRVVQERKNV